MQKPRSRLWHGAFPVAVRRPLSDLGYGSGLRVWDVVFGITYWGNMPSGLSPPLEMTSIPMVAGFANSGQVVGPWLW